MNTVELFDLVKRKSDDCIVGVVVEFSADGSAALVESPTIALLTDPPIEPHLEWYKIEELRVGWKAVRKNE